MYLIAILLPAINIAMTTIQRLRHHSIAHSVNLGWGKSEKGNLPRQTYFRQTKTLSKCRYEHVICPQKNSKGFSFKHLYKL